MNARGIVGRVIRSPLFQLGVVAILIYVVLPDQRRAPTEPLHPPIRIAAADLESAVWAWERVHGAPPTENERDLILDRLAADEALFRRALELGLDETPITEVRLKQLSELVGGVDEHGSPQELVDDLKSQDFAQHDPIMRGHLIQTMKLIARKVPVPSGDELISFYDLEGERFLRPAMYEVRHVYFSEHERGASARRDAEAALQVLRGPDAAADALGDRFNAGSRFSMRPESRLEAVFGSEVARAVRDAPVGEWIGPLESTYGWHLIRVEHSVPARSPELATISSEVLHTYLRVRGSEKLARTLRALRLRYGVEVERL